MQRLAEMGLELPPPSSPVGSYLPVVIAGKLVFTSGQLPRSGSGAVCAGKVGADVDEVQGYEAAKLCALHCLSVIRAAIGDLDRVERVVKVVGFVNSAPGFFGQPKVVNGASDLLEKVFGEEGRHARSAVGVAELPLNSVCEIEMIVQIRD